MKTAALLLVAGLALFVGWVFLRDWRPVDARRTSAQSAAASLDAVVLDRRSADTWRVRIAGPRGVRCLDVDVRKFARDPDHGYRGVRPAPCPRR